MSVANRESNTRRPRRPIPASIRADVWDRSGGVCHYCGSGLHPFRDFHVDHVRPFALGGSDDLHNLVAACRRCNSQKLGRPAETFRPGPAKPVRPRYRPPSGYVTLADTSRQLGLTLARTSSLVRQGVLVGAKDAERGRNLVSEVSIERFRKEWRIEGPRRTPRRLALEDQAA